LANNINLTRFEYKKDLGLGVKNLKIAFIGSVVSEKLCLQLPACSMAGNKMQENIIKELEALSSFPISVNSICPVAMYPKSHTIFFPKQACKVGKHTIVKLVSFINFPILKQFSIFLILFMRLIVWLWRERKFNCVVLVFNLFSPFSLAVAGAAKLMGIKSIAIIADLPHDFYDFKGIVNGLLQRIDFFIQTHIIKYFTGIITITDQISEDFAPNLPHLTIEGGIDDVSIKGKQRAELNNSPLRRCSNNKKIILYSGTLHEVNGIDLLVSSFKYLPGSKYRLHIYGRGPAESVVREAAILDKRIFYGGNLPNSEIKHKQTQATVLVNPRPLFRKLTKYTFPSKLIEYLVSGTPTITTNLPGIPEEYYPHLYFVYDETPEGLAKIIQEVCSKNPEELKEFGQQAREFVLRNKNWTVQGRKIYNFICNLN